MTNLIRPTNLTELRDFARIVAGTDLVPRDYKGKPDAILVAMQMGSELGLSPMQSVQNISVIGGRPAVWGDAMLALCRAHPEFQDIEERIEGEGDDKVAICIVDRRGQKPTETRFSVADAKRAGLWDERAKVKRRNRETGQYFDADNDSPWHCYPDRMLKMRARGFALRDAFADALKGLISAEEATDIAQHEAARRTATAKALPASKEPPKAPAAVTHEGDWSPAPAASTAEENDTKYVAFLPPLTIRDMAGDVQFPGPDAWVAEWKSRIEAVREIDDLERRRRIVAKAGAMNEECLAEAAEHYPAAVELVRAMLREAE